MAFLLAGFGGAQTDMGSPSHLAPVTDLQFVKLAPAPQPPDYLAIKKASDDRIAAARRAAALRAAQLRAEAERQRLAALSASTNTAKMFIYMSESGNRTNAINAGSGACGLGQALPCSKLPCSLSDYACQDAWFNQYAIARYGSWQNAMLFWQDHHWW
jgi:hypothetical protein